MVERPNYISPIFLINLELAGNGAPTSYQLGKD